METLAEILAGIYAQYEGSITDKGKSGYIPVYEKLFSPIKDSTKKILEIGVNHGGSVLLWNRYFPNAEIHGADIRLTKTLKVLQDAELKRFTFHYVNLQIPEELDPLVSIGEWDIIIDDASHSWKHQVTAFEKLFPAVKKGGLYIIEDVETSWRKEKYGNYPITFVEYMKNLIDSIVNINFHPTVKSNIASLDFKRNLIVVTKAD